MGEGGRLVASPEEAHYQPEFHALRPVRFRRIAEAHGLSHCADSFAVITTLPLNERGRRSAHSLAPRVVALLAQPVDLRRHSERAVVVAELDLETCDHPAGVRDHRSIPQTAEKLRRLAVVGGCRIEP